jgi:hypothetical protein
MNIRSLFGQSPSVVIAGDSTSTPSAPGPEEPPVTNEQNNSHNKVHLASSPSSFHCQTSGTAITPSIRIQSNHNNHDRNHHSINNDTNIMSSARDIDVGGLSSTFQNTLGLSVSPTSTFHSLPSSFGPRAMASHNASSKQLKPFNTSDVRILLLENVNQTAQDILKRQGYQVEFYKSSLPEDELIEKIRYVWHSMTSLIPLFFCPPVKSLNPTNATPVVTLPH